MLDKLVKQALDSDEKREDITDLSQEIITVMSAMHREGKLDVKIIDSDSRPIVNGFEMWASTVQVSTKSNFGIELLRKLTTKNNETDTIRTKRIVFKTHIDTKEETIRKIGGAINVHPRYGSMTVYATKVFFNRREHPIVRELFVPICDVHEFCNNAATTDPVYWDEWSW